MRRSEDVRCPPPRAVAKASALLTVVAEMKRLLGCRAALNREAAELYQFSALPLIPAVARPLARLPDRASVGMGAVEPGAGNVIQHAHRRRRVGQRPMPQLRRGPVSARSLSKQFDTPSLKRECRISQVKLQSACFSDYLFSKRRPRYAGRRNVRKPAHSASAPRQACGSADTRQRR